MDTGQPRSLRLLSLDGGGVGGISALLILKELMWRVKANDKLDNVPLPCHYFDLVGGTSTGGLIALMLGRLRMTIDEAIQSYAKLAQDVFSEVKRGRSERFKAHKLEHFIKEMVRIHTGDANSRMMDSGDSAGRVCRTFVCAMSAHNLNGTIPTIFRTYTAPKNQTVDCMIWEAARATSASPALFKSIQIGLHGVEETFIGGSVGCNNPAATVLSEAELVFGQHAPISCIISIGAGHPKTISLSGGALSFLPGSLPLDVRQAMNAIAQDCEGAAERVAQQFRQRPEVYFRLNVEQGMQNVTLGQWFKLGEAAAHTNQYLKTTDVDRKVDGAVTALRVAHHASSNEPDPFQTLLSPQAISPESSRPSAPTSRARTPLSEERDTTSAPPAQPALHTFSQPYNSSISNSSSAKPSASVPSADVPAGESIFSLINKNFERWKKCDDCIDAFNSVTACAVDYTKAIAALQGKLDEDSTPSGESSQQGYRQRCAMLVRDHASLGERFASRWLDMSDHEIILKVLFPETPLPSGAARSLEVNWDPLRIDLSLKTHVLVRMDGVPIFDSFVNDTSNIVVDLPQFDHRIGMLITVEVSAQASTLGPDTNGSVFQCRGKPATSQYREYPLSSDVVDANADFPYEKHPADLKTVSFGSGDVPVLLLGAYRYWPFSYIDNRMATALVAQDHNGNVAKVWQRQPARYIDRIEISGDEITFIGQANYTVVFNVNEILLQRPPPVCRTRVTTRDARTQPPLLEDLHHASPDPTKYPVLVIGTYTFWPATFVPPQDKVMVRVFNSNKECMMEFVVQSNREVDMVSRLLIERGSLRFSDMRGIFAEIPLRDLESYVTI